jgi:dihydroorotase
MIDSHVHDRDWEQSHKETIKHALWVLYQAGFDGVSVQPNTSPGITEREHVARRLREAKEAENELGIELNYGIEIGLTTDTEQVKRAIDAYREFFPRNGEIFGVWGTKIYGVNSGGGAYAETREQRRAVIRAQIEVGYEGTTKWHGEDKFLFKPVWNPNNPISHCYARSSISESSFFAELIEDAEELKFKGTLIGAHVSTPETLEIFDAAKKRKIIKVATEVTPHHCILYDKMMEEENGILLKVNPPLRTKEEAKKMFSGLRQGKIDFIGTDHAPHSLKEKLEEPFMSGFPGIPFYPHFLNLLWVNGFSMGQIQDLTHNNFERIYGVEVPNRKRQPRFDLHNEYEVDVYKGIRE